MHDSLHQNVLPRDVLKHNQNHDPGQRWVVYRNKVYSKTQLENILQTMLIDYKTNVSKELHFNSLSEGVVVHDDGFHSSSEDYQFESNASETKVASANHEEKGFSDDDDDDSEGDDIVECSDDDHHYTFIGFRLVISKAFLRNELESCCVLASCCIGSLANQRSHAYWENVRVDVKSIMDDLLRMSLNDTLSDYAKEYLTLLQRWMDQYSNTDGTSSTTLHSDCNNFAPFPLPQATQENLNCLRANFSSGEQLDTTVPCEGAWFVFPIFHVVDLTNSHEVFMESLRWDCGLPEFDTNVGGVVAWNTLPESVIANDILTANQLAVEQERTRRSDLKDTDRMRMRRDKLARHFKQKYRFSEAKMQRFQHWADTMQTGYERFQKLCHETPDTSTNSVPHFNNLPQLASSIDPQY